MKGEEIMGHRLSRRELLRRSASLGACVPFLRLGILPRAQELRQQTSHGVPAKTSLTPSDDVFLEELEKANFQFFWGQAHPETGIVQDRCHARNPVTSELGSIAATGFGLTALCIGEKRKFVTRPEAQARALNAMRFLWKKLANHR